MPQLVRKKNLGRKSVQPPTCYLDLSYEERERSVRVKLTCDLTDYDSRLVSGSVGSTVPSAYASWGVIVAYDCGARLDTLPKSLVVAEDHVRPVPCPSCGRV